MTLCCVGMDAGTASMTMVVFMPVIGGGMSGLASEASTCLVAAL
jgi:hypothetical protein